MTFIRSIRTIMLGWTALAATRLIAALLIPEGPAISTGALAWSLVPDLLFAVVLWYLAARSGWRGLRLGSAFFAVLFGLQFVNIVEAVFFLTNSGIQGLRSILNALVTYGAVAPVWAVLFAKGTGSAATEPLPLAPRSLAGRVWRVAVSDFAYVLLYLGAGLIVFPLVREFYATQVIPSLATIVSSGLLLRGPVFTGLCLLLLRMMRLEGRQAAMAVGAAFSILSGVAPLVAPNPYFPDWVRWAHFFEVSISNFMFGALVGWIWGLSKPASELAARLAV